MTETNPKAPGPGHEPLDQLAGTWHSVITLYFGGEPNTAEGTMVNSWILGGRFLEQVYSGTSFGELFEGRGWFGFNNGSQQYEYSWIDVASTCLSTEKGRYDSGSNSWEMFGTFGNPATGETGTKRTVTTVISKDEHVAKSYRPDAEGVDQLVMTIRYTRS